MGLKIQNTEPDLLFRPAVESDMKDVWQIYDYYVKNTAITFDYATPTQEEMTRSMLEIRKIYPYLVCLRKGVVVGYAYARAVSPREAYKWSVELSIYLDVSMLGGGIGWRLYEKLINLLEAQHVQTAYACITHPNPRSEHLHQALGFSLLSFWRHSGYKFQSWHDVVWMEKRLGKLPTPAPDLIPFPKLNPKVVEKILWQNAE